MPTYELIGVNNRMQPMKYRTSDGKYWDVKNPSTLINLNNGRQVKYGNFIRMYSKKGKNSNIDMTRRVAVPPMASVANNNKMNAAPMASVANNNNMSNPLNRVNSTLFKRSKFSRKNRRSTRKNRRTTRKYNA